MKIRRDYQEPRERSLMGHSKPSVYVVVGKMGGERYVGYAHCFEFFVKIKKMGYTFIE